MARRPASSPSASPLSFTFAALVFALAGLTACSTTQAANYHGQGGDGNQVAIEDFDAYSEAEDPIEPVNRAVFGFNQVADRYVLKPVAKGYRAVTPQPVRTGVTNVLRNLRSPVNAANQLLQGDIDGFGNDVLRFSVNTLIGVGGLFDVAGKEGYAYEYEDFGQTLATWGVGHGAYLVLPILGPSSLRDASGSLVDGIADPLTIYLNNIDENEWSYVRLGFSLVSAREELLDALDDLEKNSIDFYATTRSAYMQRREALVKDQRPDQAGSPIIPDYDD